MTTRSDVTVYYHLDPRLIVVQAPSTEMTMQDLHDTLSDIDDEPANMVYPHLVQSAGKDDLGGGVTVGITLTLRNAQIAFARRDTIVSSGTCTQDATSGFTTQQLISASGTFVSDGVSRGMWASNNTQGYPCEVMAVTSNTQLTTLSSSRGTWASGDYFAIWDTQVCDLTGGNLVAVDYDGNTIDSVFPTYGNTVTKTSSSSATLSAQEQLQYSTFDGAVHVNLSSSYSGTTYPVGTPQQPVNNFADALTIAQTRGFTKLRVMSSCTIDSGLDFTGIEFEGESPNKTTFTISAAANVTNCEFTNATIQGVLDGGNVLTDCSLRTITYVEGIIQRCLLLETITLSGGATAFLLDCWSGVPGSNTPTIDMGGSGSQLAVRNYSGGLKLTNRTGTDPCSIDMNSGQIIIDNTVTNGTITLRGVAKWTNESTYSGGATINSELITFQDTQQLAFGEGEIRIDVTNGTTGTAYPRGTTRLPVNNIADALVIASGRKFDSMHVSGTLIVPSGTNLNGKALTGENSYQSAVYFTDGCSTQNLGLTEMSVLGSPNGRLITRRCALNNVSRLQGTHDRGVLIGTITPEVSGDVSFTNCYSSAVEFPAPKIDCSTGATIVFSEFQGPLEVQNCTDPNQVVSINVNGEVWIHDSVASGEIQLLGIGHWENESTYAGGAEIENFLVEPGMDANIIKVSGEYVSINDFVGEAASLTTTAIADAVWDEPITGSDHNIPTSAGRRLRAISSTAITTGVCPSGGTANTILLNGDASTVDGAYDPAMIAIVNGSGLGQTRMIYQYDGANRIAVVDRNWKHIPDTTSEYVIYAHPGREHVNEGLAQAGSGCCITLNTLASDTNDAYVGQLIFLRSGTGEDQVRLVTGYNGTTKVATVDHAWDIDPDATSGYAMLPHHDHEIVEANVVQVSGVPITPRDLTSEGVWNYVMDAGYTAEETMKIMVAALAGKLAGAAGTTITIRDINDTKNRITATVDDDGNRLSVTLDGS